MLWIPPFEEYLKTFVETQADAVEDQAGFNTGLSPAVLAQCPEDMVVAYATAVTIEILSGYHAWLASRLDPPRLPPTSRTA